MVLPLSLFKHIAMAYLNQIGAGVVGEFAFGIAEEVMRHWGQEDAERAREEDLRRIAQATADEIKRAIAEVVLDVARDRPEADRDAVAGYLGHVPGLLRRSMRRTTDPSGRTLPSGFGMKDARNLAAILPGRPPRFHPGDRPLKGVDRELVELLGIGGFGEVWKAINPNRPSKRPVALKFCLDDSAKDRLLRHEARLLDRVLDLGEMPGVVSLRETYLSADPPCLEYEYVDGGELTGLIREYHARGGISPRGAARIVERLARTVGAFHRLDPPIVHRDLKPANILVSFNPEGRIGLKVADFGIGGVAASRDIERSQTRPSWGASLCSIAHGSYTPLYASHEQVRGAPPDPRDDVHALGVIWFQLLEGDLSRGAPTGMDWIEALEARGMGREWIKVLASCFESNQAKRPADAGILADRVASLLPVVDKPKLGVTTGDSSKLNEIDVSPPVDSKITPSSTFSLKGGGQGFQSFLPAVGGSSPSKAAPSQSPAVDPKPEATPFTLLFLKGKDTNARGYETDNGFVVQADSRARSTTVPSTHQYLVELRNRLVGEGVLLERGGSLFLTTDHKFDSPSTAAGVFLGRSANGRIEWKDGSKRTLKQLQEESNH